MENKTGKYFKYAIGEIILVVFGILIALQINNWNEQRKMNLLEQELLEGLEVEFTINLDRLKKVLHKNGSRSRTRIWERKKGFPLYQFSTLWCHLVDFGAILAPIGFRIARSGFKKT